MRTLFLLAIIGAELLGGPARRIERRSTYWDNGHLKTQGDYAGDVRQGEYRTWREDGTLYELRHFDRGQESGLQRSWERDGTLFLNYEMRNGRRYGFVNAKPCLPADADGTSAVVRDPERRQP